MTEEGEGKGKYNKEERGKDRGKSRRET